MLPKPDGNQGHTRDKSEIDRDAKFMYTLNTYNKENPMPREPVSENSRVALRIRPVDKALIMRAVALSQTDMTEFIVRTALREAQSVVEEYEQPEDRRRLREHRPQRVEVLRIGVDRNPNSVPGISHAGSPTRTANDAPPSIDRVRRDRSGSRSPRRRTGRAASHGPAHAA